MSPIHQAPRLRALEEMLEAQGLIKTLDSGGVTLIKNQEAAGTRTKVVPVAYTKVIRDKSYTAT